MSTISDCPDIPESCDLDLLSAIAILMLLLPTTGAIERMAELKTESRKQKQSSSTLRT